MEAPPRPQSGPVDGLKVQSPSSDPRRGVDLHVVEEPEEPIATFAAYIMGQSMAPGGEMKLTLGIPFAQVPHAMPVMRYVGGIQFEVTVRRVPMEELPEPGW
jgi:hypothetical protein